MIGATSQRSASNLTYTGETSSGNPDSPTEDEDSAIYSYAALPVWKLAKPLPTDKPVPPPRKRHTPPQKASLYEDVPREGLTKDSSRPSSAEPPIYLQII